MFSNLQLFFMVVAVVVVVLGVAAAAMFGLDGVVDPQDQKR